MRHIFLTDLFAGFESRGLSYCISRNAQETFEDTGSDLDLVVCRKDLDRAEVIIRGVSNTHGFRFIYKVEFTNRCMLFWSPVGGFVRIDIEPCIRWRFFEVISAEELLSSRRYVKGLSVPSAAGEVAVISSKVAWMKQLSERYSRRLDELEAELVNAPEDQSSRKARELMKLAKAKPRCLRVFFVKRILSRPQAWPRFLHTLAWDLLRFGYRLLRPSGLHVRVESDYAIEWPKLLSHLSLAYPTAKTYHYRLGEGSMFSALRTLFRAGLVLEECHQNCPASKKRASSVSWYARSGFRVGIRCPNSGAIQFSHEKSGESEVYAIDSAEISKRFADFVGRVLSKDAL